MAEGQALSSFLARAMPGVRRAVDAPLPRSVYRYVWQVSRAQQIRLCILTVMVFPLSLAPVELQRLIVNEAIKQETLELLVWLGVAYVVALLLHAGLKFWQQNYQARLGEGVVRLLRQRIVGLAAARAPDAPGPEDKAPEDKTIAVEGARVSIVSAETELLGGFVGEAVAQPLLNVGLVLTMLTYMAVVSPILAGVSVALLLPAVYLIPRIQRRINSLSERRTRELRSLGDELVGMAGTDTDTRSERRSNRRIDLIFGLRTRIYMLKFLAKGLTNLIGHLGPLAIVTVGGWLVIEGRTEVGTIVAFISANERLLSPTRELLAFYRQWQVARVQYRLYRDAVIEGT